MQGKAECLRAMQATRGNIRALQEKAMRWKLSVALEAAIGKAMRWKQSVARESHALEAERCVGRESHALEAERCVGSCKGKPCVGSRALQEKAMRWKLSVALEAASESRALEAERCKGKQSVCEQCKGNQSVCEQCRLQGAT